MKIEKAESQKIVLGGLLLGGLFYCYLVFLLGPLRAWEGRISGMSVEMEHQLQDAKEKVSRGELARREQPAVQLILDQVRAMIPEGAPVAWFPSQINAMLRQQIIPKSTVRMISEAPEKGLDAYARTLWAVEIPRAEFLPLVRAVADLENQQPLAEISGLTVEANRDEPEQHRVLINLRRVVRR
jgi:hypothetical protein